METGEPEGVELGTGASTDASGPRVGRVPRAGATDQPALIDVAAERARRAAAATGRATARAGRVAGHATAVTSKATAQGVVAGAKLVGRGAKVGTGKFQGFARSQGADASGLSRVTEMQVLASAGDAAFTVSLASTILALPLGQARGQVALFLITTMAPCVLLAPLVGPLLDRWRHGRRWAIGSTLALRAFLSWVLAGVVADGSPWLLPLALLCLLANRAYAVALSAGIPLVRPDALTLVVAAAGVGNALGSFAGNRYGARSPTVIASAMLLVAIGVSLVTALVYAVWSVLLLALVAGAFGQLAKLCLDALIQADTDAERTARTFAWSETRLQTAWVIGGGIGIVLPLLPAVGFGLLTAGLVGVLVAAVRIRRAGDLGPGSETPSADPPR